MMMSEPDYAQCAEDHLALLILVKQVGCHLKPKVFSRIYERIIRINKVSIHSQQRVINLRYTKSYPLDNNAWGDFQAHRKAIGLICIGKCDNEDEVAEIYRLYEDIDQAYSQTLYNSHLILFGLNKDGSILEQRLRQLSESDGGDADSGKSDSNNPENSQNNPRHEHSEVLKTDQGTELILSAVENRNSHSTIGDGDNKPDLSKDGTSASKLHVSCYRHEDQCPDLEEMLQDYVASLFWILDSKRLDRSYERQEKPPLLMTPFEKNESVGVDTDTRVYKKRCQARLRKHLGDLCLLAGLPGEALLHYQTSLDVFKSTNDFMWLAGAYEGICATSIAISKTESGRSGFPRNFSFSSFSTKRGSSANKDRAKAGNLSRALNGLDLDDNRPRTTLAVDDVIERYREAILYYSKFVNACVIEMEASLKACRIAVQHKKYIAAADFLQNIVYINLPLTDAEKIQRYSVMSELYDQIGMKRKGALFKRLAGMQCVALTHPKPAWQQCYFLLIKALEGYKLSLDPKDYHQGYTYGWPLVQMRVLHELIFTARKMGTPAIAIRHLCYLLHVMFPHLGSVEKTELSGVLESYTVRCESLAQSLVLDNGTIFLPPVAFAHFPLVKSFKLSEAAPHLRPIKLKSHDSMTDSDTSGTNLFIYSPLQQPKKSKSKSKICWVQGDSCDIVLQLFNPMPYELKIAHMSILSENCSCEFMPQTLSLPAESGPYQVKITGHAEQDGRLTITGYRTKVLGVWSHCKLRDLPAIPDDSITIEVTPPLPTLHVSTTLPCDASFSSMDNSDSVVTSAATCLYAGQRCECSLLLSNTSKIPVEYITISMDTQHGQGQDLMRSIIVWNDDNLLSQLPLQPNSQARLTLYLSTSSDIICCDELSMSIDSMVRSKMSSQCAEDSSVSKMFECLLRLEYSGGRSLVEEYGRQCSVTMSVEVLPSVIVYSWDVLPSQSVLHCHLVLDLQNVTEHTMEIISSGQCLLSIGSGQCKRCAVELLRCDTSSAQSALSVGSVSTLESIDTTQDPLVARKQKLLTEHIHTFVDVRWRLPAEDKEGHISLGRLTFNPSQMTLLQLSALKWDLCVGSDNQGMSVPDKYVCGDIYTVFWTVCNDSDVELFELCTSLHVDQDHLTPTSCDDIMGTSVIVTGAPNVTKEKLSPGVTLSHECSLIFLQPGSYKVKVICQSHPQPASMQSADNITNAIINQSPTVTVVAAEPIVTGGS